MFFFLSPHSICFYLLGVETNGLRGKGCVEVPVSCLLIPPQYTHTQVHTLIHTQMFLSSHTIHANIHSLYVCGGDGVDLRTVLMIRKVLREEDLAYLVLLCCFATFLLDGMRWRTERGHWVLCHVLLVMVLWVGVVIAFCVALSFTYIKGRWVAFHYKEFHAINEGAAAVVIMLPTKMCVDIKRTVYLNFQVSSNYDGGKTLTTMVAS